MPTVDHSMANVVYLAGLFQFEAAHVIVTESVVIIWVKGDK